MRRVLITAVAALMSVGSAFASTQDQRSPMEILSALRQAPAAASTCSAPVRVAQACCKYCSKGKPCGDSCISRAKQCHKGQGCACG